jgi:hypothetical protein
LGPPTSGARGGAGDVADSRVEGEGGWDLEVGLVSIRGLLSNQCLHQNILSSLFERYKRRVAKYLHFFYKKVYLKSA